MNLSETNTGAGERKWLSEGEAAQALPVITELVFWSSAQIQLAPTTAVHILGTLWSLTLKGNSRSSGASDTIFPPNPHGWFISVHGGVVSLDQVHFSLVLFI